MDGVYVYFPVLSDGRVFRPVTYPHAIRSTQPYVKTDGARDNSSVAACAAEWATMHDEKLYGGDHRCSPCGHSSRVPPDLYLPSTQGSTISISATLAFISVNPALLFLSTLSPVLSRLHPGLAAQILRPYPIGSRGCVPYVKSNSCPTSRSTIVPLPTSGVQLAAVTKGDASCFVLITFRLTVQRRRALSWLEAMHHRTNRSANPGPVPCIRLREVRRQADLQHRVRITDDQDLALQRWKCNRPQSLTTERYWTSPIAKAGHRDQLRQSRSTLEHGSTGTGSRSSVRFSLQIRKRGVFSIPRSSQ